MGMFDYIKFSAPCKKCGKVIKKDWQSKDGKCQLEMIDPMTDKSIERFYTDCVKCGTWNEYHRRPEQVSQFVIDSSEECTTPMQNNTQESWEEEFDEKFPVISIIKESEQIENLLGKARTATEAVSRHQEIIRRVGQREFIKSFIRQLLTQQEPKCTKWHVDFGNPNNLTIEGILTQQEAKMQDMVRKMVGEERSEKLKDSMGRVLTNIKNRGYNAHRAHCIAVAKDFGVDLTK